MLLGARHAAVRAGARLCRRMAPLQALPRRRRLACARPVAAPPSALPADSSASSFLNRSSLYSTAASAEGAPDPAPLHRLVVRALRTVVDAEAQADVVHAGLVKDVAIDGDSCTVDLDLTDNYRANKAAVLAALAGVEGLRQTTVRMWRPPAPPAPASAGGASPSARPERRAFKGVKRVIAVSSCKGGVGKSTVAVNLAYALKQRGERVGIFDTDIYGPSLPTMVSPADSGLFTNAEGLVTPPVYEGVKCMSFGWTQSGRASADAGPAQAAAAMLRGPMVSNVLQQLLHVTDWGDLDYLVLDMPPGSGDVQLTLTQELRIDGAVVVTTPAALAMIDVVKGIDMFMATKVPVVAVVENMSFFRCPSCADEHRVFGAGHRNLYRQLLGFNNADEYFFRLPLFERVARGSDSGRPLVLSFVDAGEEGRIPPAERAGIAEVRGLYKRLAERVVTGIDLLGTSTMQPPSVTYDKASRTVVVESATSGKAELSPHALRCACQCALCVDEMSNERRLDISSVPADVWPTSVQTRGNYAVQVSWSDGHRASIFPYDQLIAMAEAANS